MKPERSDFTIRTSLVLAVVFALPMAVAMYWLVDTPYRALVIGIEVLIALWGVHVLVAIAFGVLKRPPDS